EFLAHASGHLAHLHPQVKVEGLRQLTTGARQIAATNRSEDRKRVLAIHPGRQTQVSGEIADIALDRLAVPPAIESEDFRGPAGGPEKAHENADRGGLAGAIRPEKSEQSAFADGERKTFDSAPAAVTTGEIVQLNQGHTRRIADIDPRRESREGTH